MNKKLILNLTKAKSNEKGLGFSYKAIEDVVEINLENPNYTVQTYLRWQFEKLITPQGIRINYKFIEESLMKILSGELDSYKGESTIGFVFNTFYKGYPLICEEINSEESLEKYINEVVKCLEFHEKEIFPKLVDVNFLAEYVGSVPFERQSEVIVGGNFPVHLFKKLAILKWGHQEKKYLDYKNGTKSLIELYAIKKPEKYRECFITGFEKLVNCLENEPNPFG